MKLGYRIARILLKESSQEGEGLFPGLAAKFGQDFGSFTSQIRLKCLGGKLVIIFYLLMKGYGNDELLRIICVPFAKDSLKQQSMHCGSVELLRTCGLDVHTVPCKRG